MYWNTQGKKSELPTLIISHAIQLHTKKILECVLLLHSYYLLIFYTVSQLRILKINLEYGKFQDWTNIVSPRKWYHCLSYSWQRPLCPPWNNFFLKIFRDFGKTKKMQGKSLSESHFWMVFALSSNSQLWFLYKISKILPKK